MPPASRGLPPESPPTLLVLFPTAAVPLEDLRADERQGLQRKGVYAVYDLLLRMFEGRTGQ